jgi:hypothetical protein
MPQTTKADLAKIMVALIEGMSASTELAARHLEDKELMKQSKEASRTITALLATLREKMVENDTA